MSALFGSFILRIGIVNWSCSTQVILSLTFHETKSSIDWFLATNASSRKPYVILDLMLISEQVPHVFGSSDPDKRAGYNCLSRKLHLTI